METTWPEAVERVSSFLRDAGAEARLEQFADGTPTAADAAAAVGCELDQIVKSLVFLCDDRPGLAMVPGSRRADPRKIASAAEASSARIAPPATVKETTGFSVGGVAPFALRRIETVFIDHGLLAWKVVWAGAGSDRHMAGIAPSELVRLTRARAIDACTDT